MTKNHIKNQRITLLICTNEYNNIKYNNFSPGTLWGIKIIPKQARQVPCQPVPIFTKWAKKPLSPPELSQSPERNILGDAASSYFCRLAGLNILLPTQRTRGVWLLVLLTARSLGAGGLHSSHGEAFFPGLIEDQSEAFRDGVPIGRDFDGG